MNTCTARFTRTVRDQRLAASDGWRYAARLTLQPTAIIRTPCAPAQPLLPAIASQPKVARGFTLIEMLVAVAVAAVLSSVALPSFEGQLHKGRRADALVSMMQVQAAQERFRSNGMSYGSLDAVGVSARSTAGHYALQVLAFDDDGYEVLAVATGAQARDTRCSHMKLTLVGTQLAYASGSTAAASNPASANRVCWSL